MIEEILRIRLSRRNLKAERIIFIKFGNILEIWFLNRERRIFGY